MDRGNQKALILARRQKRIAYLEHHLRGADLAADVSSRISQLLDTYRLLLAKIVRANTEDETVELEHRCQALERELNALFESRRLATSSIGTANLAFEERSHLTVGT